MYDLIKKELSDRKVSLLTYCLVGLALLWLYISIFPAIRDASAQLDKLLQAYPKSILQAFGIEQLSFDTLDKFMAVEQFSFTWPILAITLALSRASNSIAGSIEKGTMGLYLALPISRPNIFLAKYFAGLIALVAFAVASVLAALPLGQIYHLGPSVWFVTMTIIALLFMWVVFAAGMFFSAIFSERGKVYLASGGVLLAMYAVNIVASLRPGLGWLKNYSVFHYFNSQEVLAQHTVNLATFWVFGVAIIIFTLSGLWAFTRRDVLV